MTLMGNPSLEMEWPTEQLLRTMARHQAVYESPTAEPPVQNDDLLEFLASAKRSLPSSVIRKHLLQEIERCTSQTRMSQTHSSTLQSSSSPDVAEVVTEWERQKFELRSLESLLEQMRELDAYAKKELVEVEKLCMLQRLVMRRQAGKEEKQVAELELLVQIERAERDLAVARLRHQEAIRDLMQVAPYNVVRCLTLSSIASFSLERVSPSRVDMSFSCAVQGPRPCLRWDAKDGIGSFVLPESSSLAERAPTIPEDHVAASFYHKLLFVVGTDGLAIHPSILDFIISQNDISQTVLSLSLLMGRLDLALADLMRLLTKSYIDTASVERKGQFLLLLSVAFHDDFHVHFYYDQRCEKSLAHSIPSRVRVNQKGIRMESLEADALQKMSGPKPCLDDICDAFFIASCV